MITNTLTWALLGFLCVALPASAETVSVEEKLCIFDAAAKLPQIPGLEIKSSRTSPSLVSSIVMKVELEVHAAGQDVTISYLCNYKDGKATAVLQGAK